MLENKINNKNLPLLFGISTKATFNKSCLLKTPELYCQCLLPFRYKSTNNTQIIRVILKVLTNVLIPVCRLTPMAKRYDTFYPK